MGIRKQVDIVGQRYNRLVGIGPAPLPRKGLTQGLFGCDCGRFTTLDVSRVVRGKVKSCGCARKDAAARALVTRWEGTIKVGLTKLTDGQLLAEMHRRGL